MDASRATSTSTSPVRLLQEHLGGRRLRQASRSWPLDVKPVPGKLALGRAALRRCCSIYADRSANDAAAYVEQLAAKLAWCVWERADA